MAVCELLRDGFVAISSEAVAELRQWTVLEWLDAQFRIHAPESIRCIRRFFDQEQHWVEQQQLLHDLAPHGCSDNTEWELCKRLRVGEWAADRANDILWQERQLWVTAAPGAADEWCQELDHGTQGGARWLVTLSLSLAPRDADGTAPALPHRLRQLLRDPTSAPVIIHIGWIVVSPLAKYVLNACVW
jgi:hypothetical protein